MIEKAEWLPIPEYKPGVFPFDGASVRLLKRLKRDEGDVLQPVLTADAVWRDTRAFDTSSFSWKRTGFWSFRNEGGRRIDFEPDAYQRLAE